MNVILDCMTFNTFKDALTYANTEGVIGQIIAVVTGQLRFRNRYPSLIAFDVDESTEIYCVGENNISGEKYLTKIISGGTHKDEGD